MTAVGQTAFSPPILRTIYALLSEMSISPWSAPTVACPEAASRSDEDGCTDGSDIHTNAGETSQQTDNDRSPIQRQVLTDEAGHAAPDSKGTGEDYESHVVILIGILVRPNHLNGSNKMVTKAFKN